MSVAQYFDSMDYGPAPETDVEARAWLKDHGGSFGHFIAGHFVAPQSGKHFDTMEPATGKVTGWIDVTGLMNPAALGGDPDAIPNGIAYDAEHDRLFVTGKRWPKLFEIKLVKR